MRHSIPKIKSLFEMPKAKREHVEVKEPINVGNEFKHSSGSIFTVETKSASILPLKTQLECFKSCRPPKIVDPAWVLTASSKKSTIQRFIQVSETYFIKLEPENIVKRRNEMQFLTGNTSTHPGAFDALATFSSHCLKKKDMIKSIDGFNYNALRLMHPRERKALVRGFLLGSGLEPCLRELKEEHFTKTESLVKGLLD